MSKENRFVIQVDSLEIEDDAIFDNKELRLYECKSDMMSDICSLLNKQDKQLADLEAKLAESEKLIEELKGERLSFYTDDVRQTQVINGVHFDIEHLLVFSEYVEHENWVKADKDKEIDQLKQQLAEEKNRSKKLNYEAQKYYEDAYCNGFQNQKAIEELIKVQKYISDNAVYIEEECFAREINDQIDQQIKSLKGEK